MALLQISEPGKSTMPHEHRRVIGIDLGTTNSLVASVVSGSPTILNPNDNSNLLPSIVHYAKESVFVGNDAKNLLSKDPKIQFHQLKDLLVRQLAISIKIIFLLT